MNAPPDRTASRDFFLLEYQALQERLAFARNDLVRTETIGPLAVAAILSWGLSKTDLSPIDRVTVFLIPVIVTIVSYLRYLSRFRLVLTVEEYLRTLEDHLANGQEPGGYENFFERAKERGFRPTLRISRYIMWTSMALVTGYLLIQSVVRAL